MKNLKISPEKIFRYSYLALFLIVITAAVFSFRYFYENIYMVVYFDQSEYANKEKKISDLDTKRFDEVIRKIEARKVIKSSEIRDIFN
jgi:hypothetical protein